MLAVNDVDRHQCLLRQQAGEHLLLLRRIAPAYKDFRELVARDDIQRRILDGHA